MRPVHAAALALLLALASPRHACAAIPGADDPNAYTEHDYRRALLAFHRRSLGEAYRDVGRRDAKWDAQAEGFLDAAALALANREASLIYTLADAPTAEAALKLGQAARDASCDDPAVRWC
jgi:hypothetical protein